MKKKQIKKKEPQVVEIHIYVHQTSNNTTGGGGGVWVPKPGETGPSLPGVVYTC